MSDVTESSPYRTSRDILDRHGLIVFLLYWATEIFSRASLSHWLRLLPRRVPFLRFAFDAATATVKAWWQDIVFLLILIPLTVLAVSIAWNQRPETALIGYALSGYLLFDTIIYHVRVLWFDDLRPGLSNIRRGVSSHRRILFVAILGFAQSIALFPSLYRSVPELSGYSRSVLQERSFSAATLLSLSEPITTIDMIQVSISLFFVAIVIAAMASLAYRRHEFAEDHSEGNKMMPQTGQVQFINPDALNKSPAFTNVVVVTGSVKTVYVGGQDSVDASGTIIGKGDLKAQAEQVLKNIQVALAAGGAQLEHVIKWNLYVVHGQSIRTGFEVFQHVWANRPNPPAISVLFVSGLAHPDFLLEMDAIAVVPQ